VFNSVNLECPEAAFSGCKFEKSLEKGRFRAGASYIKSKLCSIGVGQKFYPEIVVSNLLKYINFSEESQQAGQPSVTRTEPTQYRSDETCSTTLSSLTKTF
jgi:hypothetical protein